MRTELKRRLEGHWPTDVAYFLRNELETAWLRGWVAHSMGGAEEENAERRAADYAERVVGGSTRLERPEVAQ